MMRFIAQALFRVFAVVSLNLWSVIYRISTDMFMACTVKYTKLLICISVFSEGKIKSYLSVKR